MPIRSCTAYSGEFPLLSVVWIDRRIKLSQQAAFYRHKDEPNVQSNLIYFKGDRSCAGTFFKLEKEKKKGQQEREIGIWWTTTQHENWIIRLKLSRPS